MTEDEAIDSAQSVLQTKEPSVATAKALLLLEQYIDEDIFGDLWEAMLAILPPSEFVSLQEEDL